MDEAIPLKLDAELFEGGRSKGHHQILKKQEWRRARGLAESPARAVRPGSKAAGRSASATMSEADLVAALEHKYLACLIRGREFEPQSLDDLAGTRRSEEHTSELQSLMRISYAVFCLKKKKHTDKHTASVVNEHDAT